jgi:hypothetical protein
MDAHRAGSPAWPRRHARIEESHEAGPFRNAVSEPGAGSPPPASFLKVLGAVFSSFFGVRKRSAGERDEVSIKPHHVIIAGLLGAAMLVAAVATLVAFITRHA